ncbi:MAG: murein hydrolase activator EnvC family protein [Bacillota bacterium]|jgi:murein DD-endopeptidase MepM/ murein hydrolase activator NlpD|nr:peptidoglycan DD-metalloendopeptidase family protein [Candidatus Fermentithermobacillaceae bacterium]
MKGRPLAVLALALIMIASLVAAPFIPARTAFTADDLWEKMAELERLQKEIEEYKSRISKHQKTESTIVQELGRLDDELALSERELAYIEKSIDYNNDQIRITREEIAVIEARLSAQKAAFDARLVSMYKAGQTSYIDVLLTSKSFSDLMARLHYLKRLAADDTELIEGYTADRLELVAKRESLEARLNELEELKASEEEKQEAVLRRTEERQKYLAQIMSEKSLFEKALDEMEQESKALERIIAEAQAKGQLPQRELSMIWPVTGYWITSYYGMRYHPVLGYDRFHSGIDYAADYNVPIKAAESGTVLLAGVNGGYGNCVIIDHGGGISTLYGHANKVLVKVGDVVVKGQQIALVGSTGVSNGPHLHFEVRINGQTTNPLDWLP